MRNILIFFLLGITCPMCLRVQHNIPTFADNINEGISLGIQSEKAIPPSDYLAIGDIYLGIDETTFNAKKRAFLKENPSLNGRMIGEMAGEFYKGKLYYITIKSIMYEDIPSTSGLLTQEELDSINNDCYIWSSLYKTKYKNAIRLKDSKSIYLILKRGKCTIEVRDKEHPLPSSDELEEQYRKMKSGQQVYLKYCSVIRIYDEAIIEQMKKDGKEDEQKIFKKSLDVI